MAVPGYVLKNKRTTLERAEKFISETYFTDCNLYGRLFKKQCSVKLQHFAAPDRISYQEAMKGKFEPCKVGESFGLTWSTHWFRLELDVPADWVDEEVVLVWCSNSEAMVWKDCVPLQGFTSENRRNTFTIVKKYDGKNSHQVLYVEMACNELFGAGDGYQIAPTDLNRQFTLSKAELAIVDNDVLGVILDLQILIGLVQHLDETSNQGYRALFAANEIVNICSKERSSAAYKLARDVAKKLFSEGNGQTQHTLHCMGHCHIDTAWLWPYAETIRKCARSWASTIRLMDEYPNMTFVCSQAQQFEWVKEHYPPLFEKIKQFVAQGRFIPVGGTWTELDGNIPSGESFIRQFLFGQRFFEQEFGIRCKEFWLPDTFGYSAQIPQILRIAGIERFVTQKMSWSLVNKFPHHTFWWRGIDGTRVLTHFPPGDSYCMQAQVETVVKTIKQFADKGRSNNSMYIYGYGDGGQGPTAEMVERLDRMKDIDGLPKVHNSSPDEFFTRVETHESSNLCEWSGELYLELHNGTYTTQAKVKKGNRQGEIMLHDVELLSSWAVLNGKGSFSYPHDELRRLWKLLLLNQFHDVLPGTSINAVYVDVFNYYKDIMKSGKNLLENAEDKVISTSSKEVKMEVSQVVFNTCGWPRSSVVSIPITTVDDDAKRQGVQSSTLAFVKIPAFGYGFLQSIDNPTIAVSAGKAEGDGIFLRNEFLDITLDSAGRLVSLQLKGSTRNAIAPGKVGNQFSLFDDVPLYWDAWDVMDYHLETRRPLTEVLKRAKIVENGPLRATVQVTLKIGEKSSIEQHIILDAACPYLKFSTEVQWHESHKFLKVEFPVDVLSQQATYEIQCGHLQRPTHMNTSWDWAKFEVCGHKWADLSEHNFGVAVLNDSKFGWSCFGNVLALSLLRSPKSPDPLADMGTQNFTYAVMPHIGTFQEAGVIRAAYELNYPLHVAKVKTPAAPYCGDQSLLSVDHPAVIVETIKMAENDQRGLVLRAYESFGGRCSANIKLNFPLKKVLRCNALEDLSGEEIIIKDGLFTLNFRPFEIQTIMLLI